MTERDCYSCIHYDRTIEQYPCNNCSVSGKGFELDYYHKEFENIE